MTEERQISKAVISRLPRYYRYLGELMEEGIERKFLHYGPLYPSQRVHTPV